VLALIVAIGVLVWGPVGSSSSPAVSSVPSSAAASGPAGGALPDGTTVHDVDRPGVVNLDQELLAALRAAAAEAADDGVSITLTSGWRAPAYQERLLREAVATYGSLTEAARWVSPPTKSAHVAGRAVDVGPAGATWLSRHGTRFDLCQVYANEPWHFELRPRASDDGCPRMYADPTEDPRMAP